MQHNLINLLPHDRIRAFRRTYFLHLFTITLLVGVFLSIAHGALLLPAYAYEQIVIAKQEDRLASLSVRGLAPEEQKANERIQILQADSSYLPRIAAPGTVSAAMRMALAIPRSDISLTSIGFYAATIEQKARLIVSGVATSRTTLRQYVRAFSEMPGVESADVPISAYAAETKIPFSLTLTGSFLP